MKFWYFPRMPSDGDPGGVTVSKTRRLPNGDFHLTEYVWGPVRLWFIVDQHFTADDREEAYRQFGASAQS